MAQKCEGNCGLWVLNEIVKKMYPENLKKSWVPFGSYLLNSTANPDQFLTHIISMAMAMAIGGVQNLFLL